MSNTKNDRLFKIAAEASRDNTVIDALRVALTRDGCRVLADLEQTVRDQVQAMLRESSSFEDLKHRLGKAGTEFLSTPYTSANAEQRAYRECDRARSRLAQEYREDIQEIAQGIRDEIPGSDFETVEDLEESLHETIDGCQRVIYTHLAKEACVFSDNDDAWEEMYQPSAGAPDWSVMAFWVVMADVREELAGLLDDQDEFDLLRASGGFEVRFEDAVSVLNQFQETVSSQLLDPDTMVYLGLGATPDGGWGVSFEDKVIAKIDEDDVLVLFRDYV